MASDECRAASLEFIGTPTPRGNADGCERKGVAEKAIRKNMKTKGEAIGSGATAEKSETRGGYTRPRW